MFLQGSTLQDFNNSILGHLLFPEEIPREIEGNAYTKCLRDKQGVLLETCKWRMEPTIVPFVRSSCHRWFERKGTDIKRTGRCPALSFATVVKN